ncbi:MAG: phenylalanine--tRNA ligase subunit beta [Bradymonadaceae bacterium]|nr:phenylalanine--tRNA ligase subunit beta [Lujinxingiaceae bacterium]
MKISLNWLNDWIDVSDLAVSELERALTMAGLEVEAVEHLGQSLDIVVGRIERIEEHPKADRLVVCTVDTGLASPLQIVCGAKNMKAGDRVPVALAGSQPPAIDFAIVERKVMSVLSQGMLCSEQELGLAKESEGLLILAEDLTIGQPVFEALGLRDTLLHIGLTPNRADCLSHLGIAREVSAIFKRPLRAARSALPTALWAQGRAGRIEEAATLRVEDRDGCPSYALAVLEEVTVGPSPMWLRQRLTSLGMRSINNLVDVTNFVMMDVGQPLHAFDLDKLSGQTIVVRRARAGEKIIGIDHREYTLSVDDLVIADQERPVAIAGVMGGVGTEVSEQTRRILVECAYFDPKSVRRSARRHTMHTESSHRFERGVDPGAILENLQRAIAWFEQASPGKAAAPAVRQGVIHVEADAARLPHQISLEKDHANRLLGTRIGQEQAAGFLTSLGLTLDEASETAWRVGVPSWRGDLERDVDLVEEIARLYGYDHVPSALPSGQLGYVHSRRPESEERATIISRSDRDLLRWMRSCLLDHGLYEAVNYSFMSEQQLDELLLADNDCRRLAPRISNPLVKGHSLMRTTLVASLLENLRTNRAQRIDEIALFESGRRYFQARESRTIAFLLSGRTAPHWSKSRAWDFFDAKGLIEALATPFETSVASWAPGAVLESYLHPGVQACWTVDGRLVASAGQIHPEIAQREGFDAPVFVAEIDLEVLLGLTRHQPKLKALPRHPASARDFALLYDRDAPYSQLRKAIDTLARQEEAFGQILESVELFDLYQGEQIPAGKRSLALSIIYRAADRTLTEGEVERANSLLIAWLAETVGAQLR